MTNNIDFLMCYKSNFDILLDPDFDPNINGTVITLTLQADGKMIIGDGVSTARRGDVMTSLRGAERRECKS